MLRQTVVNFLPFFNMSPLDLDWMDPNQNRKGGPMNVKVPDIDKLLERDG